jgi:predicted secreted hydrolase
LRPLAWSAAALLLAASVLSIRYLVRGRAEPEPARLTVSQAMGGEAAGFERALKPRPFSFPRDHGPHEGFKQEWWYFTGNLRDPDGRRFGYQLTFFRIGLSPAPPPRRSKWAAGQVYLAHFTLTDVSGGRFESFERADRAALDLAGAASPPFRVWLEDWRAASEGEAFLPLRLHAAEGRTGIDLFLSGGKPVVLQGNRGLSRKGPAPGDASYYYSITRINTSGTVTADGKLFRVEGSSWLDREWSTSALAPGQVGWDWFGLQLDDGREIMYYRMRHGDGSADPASRGTLVGPDGSTRPIDRSGVTLSAEETWRSPRTGVRYPARWRLEIPDEGLALEIVPRLPDQELAVSVRYWEGAVTVSGTSRGRGIGGEGYVELTGYGGELAPGASR